MSSVLMSAVLCLLRKPPRLFRDLGIDLIEDGGMSWKLILKE